MIFKEYCIIPYFFSKLGKMSRNLLPAAVMIGALMIITIHVLLILSLLTFNATKYLIVLTIFNKKFGRRSSGTI